MTLFVHLISCGTVGGEIGEFKHTILTLSLGSSYLQLPSGHELSHSYATALRTSNNWLQNYPLRNSRMCCVTLIVSPRPTRVWNLQSQIRALDTLFIHKFLMRSLSCWILKSKGGGVYFGRMDSDPGEWDVIPTVMKTPLFLPYMINAKPPMTLFHTNE